MGQTELVFIDANILLEFILDNDKADECEKFLLKIKNNQIKAITSDFIIYTCFIQIQYQIKSLQIMEDFFKLITELKGLEIYRPFLNDISSALSLSKQYKLDFDDSLVVSSMLSNGITTLISLDKDFDKVPQIRRLEPEEYLKNN